MDAIKVLVTGSGAPGTKGTLYSLYNNYDDRKIITIGTDIRDNVIGKYLCDEFFCISPPNEKKYLEQLINICIEKQVDIIIPQNTSELLVLSYNKKLFEKHNINILTSDYKAIKIANDKYKLLEHAKKIGIPTPKYHLVSSKKDLIKYANSLGWPDSKVVIKPPCSNGSRGFRIINEKNDDKAMFYYEKPNNINIKMDYLLNVLGNDFSPLLVMEYLPNDEYSVDVLKIDNYIIIPRKRNDIKTGITFHGTVEYDENIIEYVHKLSDTIGLEHLFGFQFILDKDMCPKLIESNPRIQGTMGLSTLAGANIIYSSIKNVLGEKVPELKIKWGTELIRYWGGIGIYKENIVELI